MGNICCEDNEGEINSQFNSAHKTRTKIREEEPETLDPPDLSIPQNPKGLPGGLKKQGAEKYQSIKFLGRGTFGNVVLAEDKQTHQKYAMKIIDKRKIREFNLLQCELIKKISNHELFVRIRETFQNENLIYIVMEPLERGDIYFYLRRKECIFTEEIIKNLVSEIIVSFQILHSYDIIYRELKPENILVTADGHIKLTDYGLSKMLSQEKSSISTFMGTLEYTAPEALKGNYGREVDLWALGTLIFELRFQKNPFEPAQFESVEQIQKIIEKTNIEDVLNEFIGKISHEFRDVVLRLLQKDPTKRITVQELKQHKFFKGIDWEGVAQRKNPPPLKSFIENDHIKFRDPTNEIEIAHRNIIENHNKQFKANLYEFRSSE